MLPTSVTVMEVSPRDGLQNEDVLVSTEDKLRLIDHALPLVVGASSHQFCIPSACHKWLTQKR